MSTRIERLARLARSHESKIVLLVLDGVGDLKTAAQPETPLEAAATPNLDELARGGSLGRIVPAGRGITPGSGPGHLALFGFDPWSPQADIGRGVLEALGLGLTLDATEIAARGNFATADGDGNLLDRRAGRIPTEEGRRVCAKLQDAVRDFDGAEVRIEPGEAYRFVVLLRGDGLSAELADTDPQKLGVPPLPPRPLDDGAQATAALVARLLERFEEALADEPQANRTLLRGFSRLPDLPSVQDLYRLRAGCFAGYPLYRGVASACGMEVIECGKSPRDVFETTAEHWQQFDYFFLHVKQTDQAGEDGDAAAKARVLEEVDAAMPKLLECQPDVLAITGDHSTPAPMRAHSWHPVPLLVSAATAFIDTTEAFSETAATRGHLGSFPSDELMGVLLAHAGRLAKYGA